MWLVLKGLRLRDRFPSGRTSDGCVHPLQHDYGRARPCPSSEKPAFLDLPMATPRILILRAPGANCDAEAQFAFEQAGGVAERVHVNRLREQPSLLQRYQVLVIPGGFT